MRIIAMKKWFVLVLGFVAVGIIAPNEGQTQQQDDGQKPAHHNPLAKHNSADPLALFDRIAGGKSYITPEDVAGLDAIQADLQSYMSAAGGTSERVSREQFYDIVQS